MLPPTSGIASIPKFPASGIPKCHLCSYDNTTPGSLRNWKTQAAGSACPRAWWEGCLCFLRQRGWTNYADEEFEMVERMTAGLLIPADTGVQPSGIGVVERIGWIALQVFGRKDALPYQDLEFARAHCGRTAERGREQPVEGRAVHRSGEI